METTGRDNNLAERRHDKNIIKIIRIIYVGSRGIGVGAIHLDISVEY